jgi:ABC-type transporter Mla subunit MlaD
MVRPGIAGLALLAAASLTLVACGGDTAEKNDYVDEVNKVTSTLQSGLTEVGSGATVDSPDQAAAVFEDFGEQLDAAVTGLDGVSAPEDVAGLHDEVVENLRTLEDEATGAANEIRTGGAGAIAGVSAQFLAEANRIGIEIDSTVGEINSQLQG